MPAKGDFKLKVLIGGDKKALEAAHVNDPSKPTRISNDVFEGDILVRIKGFDATDLTESGYFDKTNNTSSIQIRGTIKADVNADDILFGNDFDEPIASSLPPGTSIGLKALKWIDPGLETDLYADQPWAFSPLVTTMTTLRTSTDTSEGGAMAVVEEDLSSLLGEKLPAKQRRNYFADAKHRQKYSLSNVKIEGDFANNFIDFPSIYWQGQPFRYTCKTRDGRILFCVVFELTKAK